jgi:ankyrin repeat protein
VGAARKAKEQVWTLTEHALLAGDVTRLERLLREHDAQFREERPPASTDGGLAPDYSSGDAAGVGRLDLVKAFFNADGRLQEGATDAQMKDGFTWACEFGHAEVIDFLIARGMNIAARLRHHGQTGMHWAAGGGHVNAVGVLLKHGAAVDALDDDRVRNAPGMLAALTR